MKVKKKKRNNKNKKKIIIIISIVVGAIILLLVSFLAIKYYIEKKRVYNIVFKLNGEEKEMLEVFTDYEEKGCSITLDDKDLTKELKIDSSSLNTKLLGDYQIKYYIIYKEKEYKTFRTVSIIDMTSPKIELTGGDISILVGESYKEPGFTATDNYDGDLKESTKVENNIDNKSPGDYEVIYTVQDKSGNTTEVKRKVTVKKPNVVKVEQKNENKEKIVKVDPYKYSNTVTSNNFTDSGIYLEGYVKNNNNTFKLTLKGDNEYPFDLTSLGSGKYKGNINLSEVANGTYNVYITSGEEEKLQNKMDFISQIKRSKVGNKLVSLSYDDGVKLTIGDFGYQYDVVIDPGHGGSDSGASNEYIYEKEMNLKVSQYEKCRYENHGLKVYMTRNSDTYGDGMGSSSLSRLHRRAYEIGYIGAVSKIVYSNHHNAISIKSYMGYEMLIPGALSSSSLTPEINIANKFNSIYPLKESHLRFFATDYDTEKKYNKLNGSTYSFKDNYAVNRIPYQVFNTKAVIYEGCYLTNKEDFDWYWNQKNWIKISEAKIEGYLNHIGIAYDNDNTSCIS